MAVWVVAEAAQLALASDVMLAASAGTVFSGHAFGAVAHRKAAQPGLTWGRAVVAVAHESRPSPRQLLLRERIMGTMTSAQKNDWMACVTKCARELGAVRADPPSKRLRIRTRGDLAQAEEGLCDGQLKGLCPGPTGRLCAVPDGV